MTIPSAASDETAVGDVPLGDVLEEVDQRAGVDKANLPILSLTKDRGLIPQAERFKHRVATDDVSDYKVVQTGHLVYNPYVLWEGAIHTLPVGDGLVSPVYPVWKATGADPWYLDYVLRSPPLLAEYERIASGTVKRRRAVRKDAFCAIRISLPSIDEQRRIAHVLSTIQSAKEATEKVGNSLAVLKEAVVRKCFMSDESVLPSDWRSRSCGELCDVLSVGIVVRPTQYYSTHGVPAFRSLNVRQDQLDMSNLVFISEDAHKGKVRKSALRPGDVLIVRTGNPGTSCVVPSAVKSANCIDLVFARTGAEVRPEFLSRFFNSPDGRTQALSSATGMAQQHLNVAAVARTRVPVPPLEIQDAVISRLTAVDQAMAANLQSKRTLDGLFQSAVTKLLAGVL